MQVALLLSASAPLLPSRLVSPPSDSTPLTSIGSLKTNSWSAAETGATERVIAGTLAEDCTVEGFSATTLDTGLVFCTGATGAAALGPPSDGILDWKAGFEAPSAAEALGTLKPKALLLTAAEI
jgi:hypothetical protein